MNKKVSLILSIAIAFIGIIFISIYGIVPENLRVKEPMTSVQFNVDGVFIKENTEGVKIIEKNYNIWDNTLSLYTHFTALPLSNTDSVIFYTDSPQKVNVNPSNGFVTINDTSIMSFVVFVANSNNAEIIDSVVIYKAISGQEHFGDDFEWGT